MDILDDMGVSKLSAKVFFKSELLLLVVWERREIDSITPVAIFWIWGDYFAEWCIFATRIPLLKRTRLLYSTVCWR